MKHYTKINDHVWRGDMLVEQAIRHIKTYLGLPDEAVEVAIYMRKPNATHGRVRHHSSCAHRRLADVRQTWGVTTQ
jgi:hypothetical protein